MNYITNFIKSRKHLIGSSDIPACIKHPERFESLAGYERTAVTVYKEKRGEIEREPAGIPASIGHRLEGLVLHHAISEIENKDTADKFLQNFDLCEAHKTKDGYKNPDIYQNTNWLHHTEAKCIHSVSHADTINISNPKKSILIEGKTALYWTPKRESDIYSGYDFNLTGYQGIPLRIYMQTLHQCAIYHLEYGVVFSDIYVPLYHDGKFHMWSYKPDKKAQEKILQICSYMKQCIDKGIPPVNLAMNQSDVRYIYPEIKKDFRVLSNEELEKAVKYAQIQKESSQQIKAWKQKEEDAKNALSVLLADTGLIKGFVDGELKAIATWQTRKGSEKIKKLSEIKKEKKYYNYLKRNGLIEETKESTFVKVKLK